MKYHRSQNCEVNNPTMFRNVCVLLLVVLCGHAANAFAANMIIEMVRKMGSDMMTMGTSCLNKNKAGDVMNKPTLANLVHAGGCLAGCAMQSARLLKPNGKVNLDLFIHYMPVNMPYRKEVTQMMKECDAEGRDDPCYSTMDLIRCTIKAPVIKSAVDKIVDNIKKFFMNVPLL